jgi:hypothetical protein
MRYLEEEPDAGVEEQGEMSDPLFEDPKGDKWWEDE